MINNFDESSLRVLKILKKAYENQIYGSIEVFFEKGRITQITQRVIQKVSPSESEQSKRLAKSDKNKSQS